MKQWEPWSKYDEKGLARYVVPDAAAKAAELRLDLSRFDAEQQPGGRRLIAGELYRQLTARANPIRYAHEKYHPQEELQVIRTPGEILYAPGEGTCLDLALLFCGLCLSCDLLPVLVVLEGHALAAVSLKYGRKHHGPDRWDAFDRKELRRFEEEQGLLRDGKLLRRLVDQGEYIAVECTGFAQTFYTAETAPEGKGRDNGFLPFERAVAAGREQLGNPRRPFQYALDVHLLHQQGFGPIVAGVSPAPDWDGGQGQRLCTALRYTDHCLVDLDSVIAVATQHDLPSLSVEWHSKISHAFSHLARWDTNFEKEVRQFRWAKDPSNHAASDQMAHLRAQVAHWHGKADNRRKALQYGLALLREHLFLTDIQNRIWALSHYAAFAALSLIQCLQFAENRLYCSQHGPIGGVPGLAEIVPKGEPYLDVGQFYTFQDVPWIPSLLLEIVPNHSTLAKLAFQFDERIFHFPYFLRARIGRFNSRDYEYLVLPKSTAEVLQDRDEVDLETYYRWVLPQWIVHGFPNIPKPQEWRVGVLSDEHGHEKYDSASKTLW